jgi:hypothetical protein
VGTSFTLDLEALLTAPIAFALYESVETNPEADGREPVGLLEAIRRHASRITMFCQSGQIAVPHRHRTVFAWLEAAVREVSPPRRHRLFHPKIWLARYQQRTGDQRLLRLLCATRNLTFDTSWDTLLQLDSDPYDERPPTTEAPQEALVELVRRLPDMAARPVDSARRAAIEDVAADLAAVPLAVPEPFDFLQVHVLGIGLPHDDVVPRDVERALIVSPFVTEPWLRAFAERAEGPRVLISREESLDRISTDVLAAFERVAVLNPAADIPPEGASASDNSPAQNSLTTEDGGNPAMLFGGLHAKLYVFDTPEGSVVLTGSANATGAAFGGNVEVVAELRGPQDTGVELFLAETPGEADLADLLVDYRQPETPVEPSEAEKLNLDVDELRRRVAAIGFRATARPVDDDFELALTSDEPLPSLDIPPEGEAEADVELTVRPVTLADRQAATPLTLGHPADARFTVSLEGLSAFFAMTLTARRAGADVSTTFLVTTELVDAPADRESRLLAAMLRDPERLLRYLLLLLSDADRLVLDGDGNGAARWTWGWRGSGWEAIPLLELLVRAADRFPDRLDHIEHLLQDLGEQRAKVLPHGFEDIWTPVMRFRDSRKDAG